MEAGWKRKYRRHAWMSDLILLMLLLLPLFLLSGCVSNAVSVTGRNPEVIRLVSDYEQEDLGYWQLEAFAQALQEKSDGALTVQLYKKDAWSKAESFVAYLDAGSIEMVCMPMEEAISMQPSFAVYKQPYLFSGLQAVENYVLGAASKKVLQQLPNGYYGIGLVADGYQYLVQQETMKSYSYGTLKRLAKIHELDGAAVYAVQAIYQLHPLIASRDWWVDLTEQEQLWVQDAFTESLQNAFVYQKDIAGQRLYESGITVQSVLPPELTGYTEQYMMQREAYFSVHADMRLQFIGVL